MAKTTMNLYYGGKEYQAEDVYRDPATFVHYEIISFMKIEGKDFVVLKISNHDVPSMHPMEDFARLVELHDFIKVTRPRYEIGDRFEHPMSNRTMRVLSVSPERCSANGSFAYFMEVIKANGKPFYNVVSETFLDKCVRDKF